jgi:hypothetical protein
MRQPIKHLGIEKKIGVGKEVGPGVGGAVTVYGGRRVVALETGESEGPNVMNPTCELLKSPLPKS